MSLKRCDNPNTTFSSAMLFDKFRRRQIYLENLNFLEDLKKYLDGGGPSNGPSYCSSAWKWMIVTPTSAQQ